MTEQDSGAIDSSGEEAVDCNQLMQVSSSADERTVAGTFQIGCDALKRPHCGASGLVHGAANAA